MCERAPQHGGAGPLHRDHEDAVLAARDAARASAAEWLERHPGDPRPTLVAFGAPMLVPAKRTMPLEEAVARALLLLCDDPTVVCSLPVVLDYAARQLDVGALRQWATRLDVAAELGMVLDLTAELDGRAQFRDWARGLPVHHGEARYLSSDVALSPRARRFTDARTPSAVARWGFRVNMPLEHFRQFFQKHRVHG